jgi:hypothetical protein
VPPQPFGVVEPKLCPLEWPLVPGAAGEIEGRAVVVF